MIWNGLIKELLNIKSEKDLKNLNKMCLEKIVLKSEFYGDLPIKKV